MFSKRPISNRNFDWKDQKQAKIFRDFPLLPLYFYNYWTFFPVNTFFSKVLKNIWTLNFEKTPNFETQKTCVQADFGKRSFFVKPKWFKFSQLETTFDQRWFQATLEVFFFRKSFNTKKRPKLGQNSPYVVFHRYFYRERNIST